MYMFVSCRVRIYWYVYSVSYKKEHVVSIFTTVSHTGGFTFLKMENASVTNNDLKKHEEMVQF